VRFRAPSPALVAVLSATNKSNKWMYPHCCASWFGVIDILFKKSLYTPAFIYEFAICDFTSQALMLIVVPYSMYEKQDVLSISSLVG
jgi:hypothetical protein